MGNFINLIQNELIKIYRLKSTWAMYIIVGIIIVGLGIFIKSYGEYMTYEEDSWRETLEAENQSLLDESEEFPGIAEFNQSLIEQNNYYLENDIIPVSYGAWQFVMENEMLLSLVSLFTIIVAAGILANEFRWGTIKLLLIRPISRTKILIAKYSSVLLFSFITAFFVLFFSWIVGLILFGFDGMNPHIVLEKNEGIEYVSVIGEILTGYGFSLINLLMMATFAFMISAIFRNSALAIGLAIFLMLAGNQIVFFFIERDWAKYILFANTDLSQYVNGNTPLMEGMTLGFSVTMLVIYYVIFVALSWVFFTKRDVAGY
ncbi:ABC transporter permease [Oceanobacillus luteolus]|uniref:ABC transporter permease n=1 Tax=Oceanobacillus luteolus TaxID=1274358 RepID=A0ABW4HV88_9BACI|nr:ABC transporter permease subunit [Oceanobacillus luteolus]MCM3741310.1 ABC transporter permease [Oceanobacillus luteolus]